MMSKANSGPENIDPFSRNEVKSLLVTVGVGLVLGVAVEMVDAALPKDHKMKAILQLIIEGREPRKKPQKSSYDMGRPDLGFSVTE